jgi:ATP-grasp domain
MSRQDEGALNFQGLVLLAEPYVSNLLQDTIVAMNLAVVEVEPMPLRADVRQQVIDAKTAHMLINTPQTRVYMSSENALAFYLQALQDNNRKQAIALLKDKRKFRGLLADIFPELAYREVLLSDLRSVNLDDLRFPLVLKPSIGFFSAGVVIVPSQNSWDNAVDQLTAELDGDGFDYPESVLNREKILIEDYIDGPEYAIDAFFDEAGEPVLLDVMYHVFPSEDDTRDILYLTHRKLIESLYPEIMDLLHQLGQKLSLRNFPFHLEVRQDSSSGRLVPIEVNPYRFAGWGTADLATFAHGINVYSSYFKGISLDWNSVQDDTSTTAFTILHPPMGTRFPVGWNVDQAALVQLLGDVLELRLVDHERWGILGIAFVRYGTQQQAEDAAHLDLRSLLPDDATAAISAD